MIIISFRRPCLCKFLLHTFCIIFKLGITRASLSLQAWLKLYWKFGICFINCMEHEDMESNGMSLFVLDLCTWVQFNIIYLFLTEFKFNEVISTSWWRSSGNYFLKLQSQRKDFSSCCNWWNDPHFWYPFVILGPSFLIFLISI